MRALHRDQSGFVFQHFGPIPTLTVVENIALPALFERRPSPERAEELPAKAGLEPRRNHSPHELSGGEMQRVAIARALMNEPSLLLADEPTGNLDTATGEVIIELFDRLDRKGLTSLVMTHNPAVAEAAHRQIELVDGHHHQCPKTDLQSGEPLVNLQTGPA